MIVVYNIVGDWFYNFIVFIIYIIIFKFFSEFVLSLELVVIRCVFYNFFFLDLVYVIYIYNILLMKIGGLYCFVK